MIQIVFFLAFAAFAVFYGMSMKRKRSAGLGPAFHRFLERTGYRYLGLPDPSLATHAAHGATVMANMTKGYQLEMVRDFHGAPIHNHQGGQSTRDGWSSTFWWRLPLAAPPRVLLQVADRSLAGVGKVVKEAMSNTSRTWAPIYPVKVVLADPELERRLVCFAQDADAAQRVLATPGLKERLLACTEVDLTVTRDAVTFSDPFAKNLNIGRSALGDVGKMMEMQIPVHDRIADLLVVTARATA